MFRENRLPGRPGPSCRFPCRDFARIDFMPFRTKVAHLFASCSLLLFLFAIPSHSQTPGSATLREIRADGSKRLTEAQVISLTGLQIGSQVSRDSLQMAADKLVHSGLFAHVKYDFHTRGEEVTVNFHVEET